ncbi:tail fiber protein [Flavobacterium sp. KACC 22758]|uniref:tail fiber protein n=1 Tax=Flavobacterium sp. KACC 22758 TaxID=3025667 RepID=UPI0023654CBD|nr:tail fiber protein [Flavobacterium sp. KACC 22758]WDF59574.1 tail fiber protein [Flavobacterium sp. KACC 22758]
MKMFNYIIVMLFSVTAFSQIVSPNGDNLFYYNGLADVTFRFLERGNGGRAFVHATGNVFAINYEEDFNGGTRIGKDVFFKDAGNSYISSGNFGIGTSQPTSILSVGITHGVKLSIGNPSWANLSIIETGYTNQVGDFTEIKVPGHGVNDAYMRMTQSGNVGIGTSSPNSKLDLGSGYGTKGAKLLIYNDDSTSELSGTKCGFYMDNFTSNNLNLVFPEASSYPGLFTISAKNTANDILKPYFSIAGLTGNVGIGTTKPDSKLTVAGNIHAQEVKVTINAGVVPDYVFANDYELKSLNEVEEYIKKNNHLPEIPSAQEIENDGLMLAEMNMNLLKKIEEMTLYMIEQHKQIIDLRERLDKVEVKSK